MDETRTSGIESDEALRPLCLRVLAGELVAEVARATGVAAWRIAKAQARLQLRVKDLPPEARARRRRAPAYEARTADYRYREGDLCEGQWIEISALYEDGWTSQDLSLRFGYCDSTIRRGLRLRKVKRKPKAERSIQPKPRGIGAAPALPTDPALRAACAFDATGGPAATRASALAATARAAEAGNAEAVDWLSRALSSINRATLTTMKVVAEEARQAKALPSPHPDAGGAVPPHEGEGDVELHPHQRPPAAADDGGDWSTWVLLGGRGAGKTLAGASWLAEVAVALGAGGRVAIVGATLHDAREVMIEGPSGIMGLSRWAVKGERPVHVASRRRVEFPGGCVGMVFSAEDADSLRGPQFHAGWADEFCAWSGGSGDRDVLAMVRLGLRLGEAPRLCVTTTPRPTRALRALLQEPGVAVARAATRDNAAHLSPGFVARLERLYGGTRLAAQEIEGQVVDDGRSLWTAETIAAAKAGAAPGGFERVVVGVDPTATKDGDACGVVVVGRAGRRAHVLADWSVRGMSPEGWSQRVAEAVRAYGADQVVAEVNQGGDMVNSVLKTGTVEVPVRTVRASVGKAVRAEPVAALYEQGRVTHAAGLERLEEELMALGGEDGGSSLDRADALVWAVTALLVEGAAGRPGVRML